MSANDSVDAPNFELLIVTGLSGAGRSTALQVLEDLNFFTADGLPPESLPEFYNLFAQMGLEHFRGLAVGVDFRRGASQKNFDQALGKMLASGIHPSLIYLEAKPNVILRRYSTTRRPHPLEREGLSLEAAMAEEVRRMSQIRASADLVLDTSTFSLHDLRREIQRRWGEAVLQPHSMRINLVSFGYKYGVPTDADLVFDLRFLPNPYFEPDLQSLSGLDAEVADYIFSTDKASSFRDKFLEFMLFALPLYEQEGRYRLTVALGCTGGRHRSVAMTELLAHALRQTEYSVALTHKHLNLG